MKDLEHRDLWERFWHDRDSVDAIGALLEVWMPLVHRILRRLMIRLPSHVAAEDLLQSAVLGLYEAVERFDPRREIKFTTFASRRIRGAVLDELRASDHMSRTDRARMKKMERAIEEWSSRHGAPPREDELAEMLGMSSGDLAALLERARPWLSLDQEIGKNRDGNKVFLRDVLTDCSEPAPDEKALRQDALRILRCEFRKLSSREQKILYLYYFEELRLSEISALFEVSEARICQIHGLVIAKLRAGMTRAGLLSAA